MKTRDVLRGIAVAGALGVVSACSLSGGGASPSGEDFPAEPVTITVPYAPGGPNDVVARALAPCLGQEIGGTVVVENKTGGGGAIGTAEVARSEPDGYSLALVPTTGALLLLPLLEQHVGYSLDDFSLVAETFYAPSAMFVRADAGFGDAKDFFDKAKAEPGSISVGTAGAGTVFDLELKYLATKYGVPVKAVPFDGGAEAQAALLGGNVDAVYSLASRGRLAAIESGELKALATGNRQPVDLLPDVPTLASLGYDDLTNSGTSFALVGPTGLPDRVRSALADATTTCLANDHKVRKVIGAPFVPERPATGDELRTELERTRASLEDLAE